ncbi:transcriptional regulator with XRE-family HTH domain [Kitasatospora sp. MAP12-15]|uniref:helix-turn-helix transcriptional regulator n=1 Tax=unclassified Kitasatospora TaxID=2633591 RepID=UPI0024772BA3|nr:helix-turn-helix transcriptional regulator [Kitasatospora sp. MAP12-44]MDH6112933.1 transcriptional regulator with XRE-family HTH domain [Kitasatospora sp. MAP12-44]
MHWQREVRDAAQAGDYGRVIELSRRQQRLTQLQLGEALGLSQSAVSRIEKRGPAGVYDMALLGRAAAHLQISAGLLGLADRTTGTDPVERREFLGGAAAVVAAPVLAAVCGPAETGQAAALRLGTMAYRRLDGSTPSRDLADAVRGHIQLIQRLTANSPQRLKLAAVGSEAAGLAGWLAWDMGDHGSARSWYGQAIKAARVARDPLLVAYQTGTLAQFEAHAGNAAQALSLAGSARKALGAGMPTIADAWLASVEALAHAVGGDARSADRALVHSRAMAARREESPPWPWVFAFDEGKVAACRVTCGARLGEPGWVLGEDVAALATGHVKQRALLVLDIATGHLAAGRLEAAFAFAGQALDAGVRYRSGRIVERARGLRRTLGSAAAPKVVRDFDERLRGVYL